MASEPTVTIDLKPLEQYGKAIHAGLNGTQGPVRDAVLQWAVRYRGAMQERFDSFSKGGGNWPDLKPSTKRRRAKARRGAKGARKFSILRNDNLLFNAMTPEWTGMPGAIQDDIPFGVRVGYGGPAKHTGKPGGGKASIFDIARFQQRGAGRLPVREIIVEAPPDVIEDMRGDMERALKKLTPDND